MHTWHGVLSLSKNLILKCLMSLEFFQKWIWHMLQAIRNFYRRNTMRTVEPKLLMKTGHIIVSWQNSMRIGSLFLVFCTEVAVKNVYQQKDLHDLMALPQSVNPRQNQVLLEGFPRKRIWLSVILNNSMNNFTDYN